MLLKYFILDYWLQSYTFHYFLLDCDYFRAIGPIHRIVFLSFLFFMLFYGLINL